MPKNVNHLPYVIEEYNTLNTIMLNLSLDEIVVFGLMVSSFIECDEDYIRDPSQPDLEEVDGELKVLYSLREKLSKITELQNVV